MSFLDQKEQVIHLVLTRHGKEQISKGAFSPSFYSFADDDILYDAEYAGVTEGQNEIKDRIKETPRLKTQYIFQSADKSIRELANQPFREAIMGRRSLPAMQPDVDKHYVLSLPVGTSGLGNEKLPAWEIQSYGAEITGSTEYYNLFGVEGEKGKPKISIPQLDIDVQIKTTKTSENTFENAVQYSDGTFVGIEDEFVLLEIFEDNGLTQNEEFELEVFKIEEIASEKYPVRIISRKLHPLRFTKESTIQKYIVDENNLVVQNPEFADLSSKSMHEREQIDIGGDPGYQAGVNTDPNNTEYYFEVNLDRQVDPEIICAKKPVDRTRGRYARRMYRCREPQHNVRDNIYENLEEPDEACDI